VKSVFSKVIDSKFVDIFRKYRPGEGEFSFWDYRVKNALERNIGWRIDHVLATRKLGEHSVDCYVDREPRGWEKPSDHAPLVSVFDITDI
jgi:exodeoxyribonuclease-3